FYSTAKGELQRSMDAASLAGAGQLSFGDSVFPPVRQEAQNFADLNPTRANLSDLNPTGAINLDLNTGNADPDGDIVLGVWDGATFTPSLDGSEVNAVQCQYATEVPTSFLRILGFNTLPVSARAIAVANPPNGLPDGQCLFPAGVTTCTYQDAGAFTSQGCGTAMTFKNSSGAPPPDGNTAAWVNPNGTGTPNASMLRDALASVANGEDTCNSSLTVGKPVGTNNGMVQSVMSDLVGYFGDKYDDPDYDPANPIIVTNAFGEEVYRGRGWEVYVALIKTDCPFPGPINGDHEIQTFAKFVITQVINKGDCALLNEADAKSHDLCPPPYGPAAKDPSLRAVFGYYQCTDTIDGTAATSGPAPRAGIARRRRLVQ
ncbi:MAG: TadG family pilus assembly protein, partial [Candidatus Methylomirabilales bacterium]